MEEVLTLLTLGVNDVRNFQVIEKVKNVRDKECITLQRLFLFWALKDERHFSWSLVGVLL